MSIWQDLGLQSRKREAFAAPQAAHDETTYDPLQVGGGKKVVHYNGDGSGTLGEGTGSLVSGGESSPDERDRYRGMGEAAAKRGAYQVNFGKAMGDEARGMEAREAQNAGANGLRTAAMGGAPSQAAILGNQAAGQSLEAQMAAGAGGRGGMGAAAAQMQAARGASGQQLNAMGQYAGMRGAEMQHAQQAYGQAGGAMRAGDYAQQGMAQQRAEAQGQAEMSQRQLNQQAQMGYEQMGINDQQDQMDGGLRRDAMQSRANADALAAHDARNARTMDTYVAAGKSIATMGGSDERMKSQVVPLYEDAGSGVERHWDRDVSPAKADTVSGASLSAPAPKYSSAKQEKPKASMGMAAAKAKPRKMTDAELEKYARELQGSVNTQKSAQLAQGPAVGQQRPAPGSNEDLTSGPSKWEVEWNRSRGNASGSGMSDEQDETNNPQPYDDEHTLAMSDERTKQRARPQDPMGHALETGMKPFQYEYKPGFTEAEGQQPGEKNVGPMAQDMASNPITGSAVKKDPNSGLLMIDMPKVTKLNSAGIGYLAAKQRKLEEEIASLKGGR